MSTLTPPCQTRFKHRDIQISYRRRLIPLLMRDVLFAGVVFLWETRSPSVHLMSFPPHHLRYQVTTNAFAVSTLRSTEPAVGHVQSVNHSRVAVGLYCTAAMLNHSCVPNALATFDGGEMRITTTRVIDSEEPVTISYGPLLSKASTSRPR